MKKPTHFCLFHVTCLKDYWEFGMPIRLYFGEGTWWTVPFTKRRLDKIWELAPLDDSVEWQLDDSVEDRVEWKLEGEK